MQAELKSGFYGKISEILLYKCICLFNAPHITIAMTPLVLLMVAMARAQDTTPDYTVTYNPGQDCLPYDGSVIPDCKKFVDPIKKQPYYHEHSTNCSRFWECGPLGETCLIECANCQHEENGNAHCEGRWALVFDVRYQYPDGPVCDWPGNVDCSNVVCDEMDPRPECCQDSDCQNICSDAFCSTSFNCVHPDTCSGETTTEQITFTYNPIDECLPYDGSVVPDCSKYSDLPIRQPYYVEHSSNCSKFWECVPGGETCLWECASCQQVIGENELCAGSWALHFDVQYQYPVGPVCDWPSNVDCSNDE